MNDREITSSRTRLRRRGTGDRAVARLPGQPAPVRPARARACPTTSGDVRLPRLGKIRQARRLHVHRQQPDRRPRRRHHALAARLGGAGGPRRLRPPAIDWVLEHPERVSRLVLLNTDYWRMPGRLRPRRRSGCSPLRSSVGQPVRCRCGWVGWCFAACTGGRWGASSGRGVGAQFIPQLYEQFTVRPHCARGVPRAHHRSIAVDGPGQLLTTITAIVEAASTPPCGAAKSPSPTCTSRGRSPS
jgi:hypothetical protein